MASIVYLALCQNSQHCIVSLVSEWLRLWWIQTDVQACWRSVCWVLSAGYNHHWPEPHADFYWCAQPPCPSSLHHQAVITDTLSATGQRLLLCTILHLQSRLVSCIIVLHHHGCIVSLLHITAGWCLVWLLHHHGGWCLVWLSYTIAAGWCIVCFSYITTASWCLVCLSHTTQQAGVLYDSLTPP